MCTETQPKKALTGSQNFVEGRAYGLSTEVN